MHGPAPAVVPGVQRGEQVDHLRPADLAHDEPVRAHPKGLPDEVTQRDLAGALQVGRAGLEPHDVRVVRTQLPGVLDEHDAFTVRHEAEQRGQQRRLSGAGAARDQKR